MKRNLIPRQYYLEQLKKLKDTDVIKVLTGMRRSGKSSLLKMMISSLKEEGITSDQIIEMDFSSLQFNEMNYKDVYNYIINQYKGNRLYIFLDEIQEVKQWEKAINSLKIDIDCDIYLTGSNAYLLAGEFSTYLSGRFIVLEVYPLSFLEYLDFLDLKVIKNNKLNGEPKYQFENKSGERINETDLLNQFIRYGSLPEISIIDLDKEIIEKFLEGIYQSVFIRDITTRLERHDTNLLERIIRFLADNIGNRTSANTIKNKLISSGLDKKTVSHKKVQEFIDYCVKAFLFYPAKRYDLRGKEELSTLSKYYITDLGIRNVILQDKPGNRGFLLENLVFMELLKRGFKIHVGKRDKLEIDFIASKNNKTYYIQVTQTLENKNVFEREISPLKNASESYKRMIITENTGPYSNIIDGVEIVNIIDFLVDQSLLT